MELRHKSVPRALQVLRRATAVPAKAQQDEQGRATAQSKVHRHIKVWALYTDIEENMGTFDTAKAVYSQMLTLRVATPEVRRGGLGEIARLMHCTVSNPDYHQLRSLLGEAQAL